STSKAITYNPALAPVGAALTGTIIPTSEGSTAELTVFGLLPHRSYAVYAYTRSCGVTTDAAGTRFGNRLGPAAGGPTRSADSRSARPGNEIGLVVRTDGAGAGTSRATVPFMLTNRVPGSMMVQDSVPPEDSGQPGEPGDRIACLTLSRR